jgi:muramoyltetrapeptide carboxypeptidase
MKKPRALKPGDAITIIAPASPVQKELFLAGVHELESMGFRALYTEEIFHSFRYLSGTDEQRALALNRAFADPDSKAIFCARGGYGTIRLLPFLEPSEIRKTPKLFLGSSDATALLIFLTEKCRMPVLHGPMPATEIRQGESKYDRARFLQLLTSAAAPAEITVPGASCLREGKAHGVLTGGCLSVLASLMGTPYEPNTQGKILFLEDQNMKPYQIDRILTQFKLAGKFDGVQGVIFGEMPGCIQNKDQGYSLPEVLLELLAPYPFPILYAFPSGHTDGKHIPLPFGLHVTMNSEKRSLKIEEPLVKP